MPTRERKQEYFKQMTALLDEYSTILIVGCDNVGSNQMQKIRIGLRGKAVVLMGKNTLMRKVINNYLKEHPGHGLVNLLPAVVGNIGLIFTNGDIGNIRDVIKNNRVGAPARVGQTAECDVTIPPGPTGCDPGQTAWFQALNVATKIQKGQIEIVSEQKIITKGNKVGPSEVALLSKLNIKPFTYGLTLLSVYDNGSLFDSKALEMTSADLKMKFISSVRRVAAASISLGYPTLASLPHSVGNRVRDLLAVSAVTSYKFKYSEPWDALFSMDPAELAKLQAASASASAAASAGGAAAPAAAAGAKAAPKAEEKEVEVDMSGGNLFGAEKGADGY
jgi:large subunit ribosomal protein LP0